MWFWGILIALVFVFLGIVAIIGSIQLKQLISDKQNIKQLLTVDVFFRTGTMFVILVKDWALDMPVPIILIIILSILMGCYTGIKQSEQQYTG